MAYEHVLAYRDQVYRCNTCGRCPRGPWDPNQPDVLQTPAKQCPTYELHRALNASSQGTMLIIRELLEGALEPSPALVEALYECLLCEGCNAVCAGRDEIPLGSLECSAIFRALRADLVELGVAPPPAVKKVNGLIADKHNRQGTQRPRDAWAAGLGLPTQAPILIFTGCTAAYQDNATVQSLAKILRSAGVEFGLLADEWCCGAIQLDSGMLAGFKASAQHNVEAIRRSGATQVVTTCADCYKTLKLDYPEVVGELGFEVLHASELVAELLEEGKIQLKAGVDLGGKAAYFDPCFLARSAKVTEEPRAVLHAIPGSQWVELEGYGRYTYCCGRPIMASASRDVYVRTGQDRVKDVLAADARTVVTGCANCKESLTTSAKKLGADVQVIDLVELVAKSLA
jgi:heterodisulfide reductase subunit D